MGEEYNRPSVVDTNAGSSRSDGEAIAGGACLSGDRRDFSPLRRATPHCDAISKFVALADGGCRWVQMTGVARAVVFMPIVRGLF